MEDPSQNAQTTFNAAADPETRGQARKALSLLLEEYARQSKTLNETFKGNTKFTSGDSDRAMAKIIAGHLEGLGFQIQLAALTCARLDGVEVTDLIGEIKTLIGENADRPVPPGLR